MPKILEKRQLTPITQLFRIDAPMIAAAAQPGQFIIIRVRDGGERIPLTIADYDRDAGTVTIVVQEVGATTRQLGAHEPGEEILDMVGPLGEPADIPSGGHVIGIGGGFGAAALLCLMRELTNRGDNTTVILGARNQELLILVDELRAACRNLELCTDDGSVGFKGFVTQRLEQLIEGDGPGKPDHVIAIGPPVMMRAVAELTRPHEIDTHVSMDPLMVDGTGMCGGCRVSVGGEVKFACVDGPIFDGHAVDFNEAVRRSKMYVKEEEIAACRAKEGGYV
ncbi:MAG: sulfide/dihydroorotate dehydrogenase-like FAD/NAD-binding protein [Planctomycetota bacterium]|jgi:ferredoxin--NADP+ reductase|nr:sulfide/dihydroorotate dehydrogenase-like FAD/NAD-binding protein [Planctomycetota bacterium]MDP7131279.1 sulfide/dihydroorotate dehydrogenase-like FAD/NAD-binding protein [Planctomycetota bacterium]